MPELLRMPEVAAGATSALLSSWSVPVDAEYASGSVIAVIETDKAVVDMEAEAPGRILRTLVAEGTEVAVGDPIAVTAAPGEQVDDLDAAVAALGAASTAAPAAPASEPDVSPSPAAPAGSGTPAPPTAAAGSGRIFISPIARKRANEAGIDVTAIVGTGPNGRIRRRDVEAAIAAGGTRPAASPSAPAATATPSATEPGFVDIPHTRLRRAIATRLTESVTTAPHFYVKGSARVDRLMELRAEINAGEDVKVSVNDLLVKAMARAHSLVPAMNVIWTEDHVRQFSGVDIAIAVATDTGLVTPVLRGVEALSVTQIARASRDLAERARSGQLRQHELEGGTTSISNLGMYGTEEFTAIINPPHSSILAVGAARPEPVVVGDSIVPATVLRVILSVDHRPVDGAIAAQWMREFTVLLESPGRILA
ncbi:MAG: 2-oxo acid dehydrogenase subunit E2 [Actinomycetales bacterium]|nr:2-oxo acid dehydrogenase subunit E2 [Actinomycetales bacterium]